LSFSVLIALGAMAAVETVTVVGKRRAVYDDDVMKEESR
jgi:hypothetical protein